MRTSGDELVRDASGVSAELSKTTKEYFLWQMNTEAGAYGDEVTEVGQSPISR